MKVQQNFRLDESLVERLRNRADSCEQSATEIVAEALISFLDGWDDSEPLGDGAAVTPVVETSVPRSSGGTPPEPDRPPAETTPREAGDSAEVKDQARVNELTAQRVAAEPQRDPAGHRKKSELQEKAERLARAEKAARDANLPIKVGI